jgi:hypothetical protein
MEDRLVDAEKIVKEMEADNELSKVEELIKHNKITFEYKEKKYRVRLLNLAEKEELDMLRRKKFGQLMKDKDIFMEKDLIIQYKNRGIDIEKDIVENIKKISAEEFELQIKLGESISKNENEIILKNYKDQIEQLRFQRNVLNTQKTLLLTYSLECALESYVYQIITYLSSEISTEEGWTRAFKTLEDFQKYEDEQLIGKLGSYAVLLQQL